MGFCLGCLQRCLLFGFAPPRQEAFHFRARGPARRPVRCRRLVARCLASVMMRQAPTSAMGPILSVPSRPRPIGSRPTMSSSQKSCEEQQLRGPAASHGGNPVSHARIFDTSRCRVAWTHTGGGPGGRLRSLAPAQARAMQAAA